MVALFVWLKWIGEVGVWFATTVRRAFSYRRRTAVTTCAEPCSATESTETDDADFELYGIIPVSSHNSTALPSEIFESLQYVKIPSISRLFGVFERDRVLVMHYRERFHSFFALWCAQIHARSVSRCTLVCAWDSRSSWRTSNYAVLYPAPNPP